ncbi:hypothetical protein DLAC_08158 [Tieghemostelium lacteum]|uniref:COX assembly mitochondrial protein n=1 Tax=Tieghemostelium lacteum TaxID=361077 RepID=A0A151ZBA7_TIELA|nr:hypothetical protein DLAC_08158 [Tieghemostelium lacteum]|eukprot:KYQ91230.1 hypothetical protein DLAC_08158 [Tieghemostelium lacteum]
MSNNIEEDREYLKIPDSEIVVPSAVDSYLRQKLKEQTLKDCAPQVAAFAKCTEDKYFSVIWECKELQQLMKNCLVEQTTSDRLISMKREWINSAKKKIYEKRQKDLNNTENISDK